MRDPTVNKRTSFKAKSLLDFDFGAGGSELLFDLVGFFLGSAFLDSLGGAFDEFLRFLQAEARDLAAASLTCHFSVCKSY